MWLMYIPLFYLIGLLFYASSGAKINYAIALLGLSFTLLMGGIIQVYIAAASLLY